MITGSTTRYEIRDTAGEVVAVHVRRELPKRDDQPKAEKTFSWETPDRGPGLHGVPVATLPLYGLPELMAAPADAQVVVTEGEKACDALRGIGIVAVATVTGANGTPSDETLLPLLERRVFLWPDHDEVGRAHMRNIAESLSLLGTEALMIDWDMANEPGDDAADYVERGGTRDGVLELMAFARDAEIEGAVIKVLPRVNGVVGTGSVAAEWEKPVLFGNMERPAFPVDALPPWLTEWAEAVAADLRCPTDLPAMLGLGTIAIPLAKRYSVSVREGWTEQLGVYMAVTLPSGEGKSPAFRRALAPVRAYEQAEAVRLAPEIAKAEQRQDVARRRLDEAKKAAGKAKPAELPQRQAAVDEATEALRQVMVPVAPRLVVDDATPEKLAELLDRHGGRMAIASAEGGGIFAILSGRYSRAPAIEVYLNGHSGDSLYVDRIGRAGQHVDRAVLSQVLCVQPRVIMDLGQHAEFRGRGLLARFLYSMPESAVGSRPRLDDAPAVPVSVTTAYDEAIGRLLRLPGSVDEAGEIETRDVPLSPDARAMLIDFAAELETRLHPASGDLVELADWTNKLTGQVARLAGLLAFASMPGTVPTMIAADAMASAIAIGRYLVSHAKVAFAAMKDRGVAGDAQDTLNWMLNRRQATGATGWSQRDLYRGVRRVIDEDHERLEAALKELERRAIVRLSDRERAGDRGRKPGPWVELSPHAKPGSGDNGDEMDQR